MGCKSSTRDLEGSLLDVPLFRHMREESAILTVEINAVPLQVLR